MDYLLSVTFCSYNVDLVNVVTLDYFLGVKSLREQGTAKSCFGQFSLSNLSNHFLLLFSPK